MDFKFSKDSDISQTHQTPEGKKSQGALLVLLLLLVGGFTYLYFFTGLIKPQETVKTAEAPSPPSQVVKIPLPIRSGAPTKPEVKIPEKAEAPKAAATAPVTAVPPVAKPAPAANPAPAKVTEVPKPAEAVKSALKKPLPVVAADKNKDTAVPSKSDSKKTVAAGNKTTSTKKTVSDSHTKLVHTAKTKKTVSDPWFIEVGTYVLEEALSADIGHVRKAGFEPIVKPSTRKKTVMNRLFIYESTDRASAQSTLEKLKRHTSDAFVIEQGGKFTVYAGSYLQNESAVTEKDRLKASGFSAIVKHADIAIPSQNLSVGPFNSKKSADAARAKLKNAGVKATISHK